MQECPKTCGLKEYEEGRDLPEHMKKNRVVKLGTGRFRIFEDECPGVLFNGYMRQVFHLFDILHRTEWTGMGAKNYVPLYTMSEMLDLPAEVIDLFRAIETTRRNIDNEANERENRKNKTRNNTPQKTTKKA